SPDNAPRRNRARGAGWVDFPGRSAKQRRFHTGDNKVCVQVTLTWTFSCDCLGAVSAIQKSPFFIPDGNMPLVSLPGRLGSLRRERYRQVRLEMGSTPQRVRENVCAGSSQVRLACRAAMVISRPIRPSGTESNMALASPAVSRRCDDCTTSLAP